MLIPINKKQLATLLEQEEDRYFYINDEIKLSSLATDSISSTREDYVLFTRDPDTFQELRIRYEHIYDIFVDTKSNTIFFMHEHDSLFKEQMTIDIMIIESLDISRELDVKIMTNDISISRVESGLYLVGEEKEERGNLCYKEVAINLESSTLEGDLNSIGCSMSMDSDIGVLVTDSTGFNYTREGALRMIAIATFNNEDPDGVINTGGKNV